MNDISDCENYKNNAFTMKWVNLKRVQMEQNRKNTTTV
jgi:hypothetical protein